MAAHEPTLDPAPEHTPGAVPEPAPEPAPETVRLKRIGYWCGGDDPEVNEGWPDPRDFIDEDWDEDERMAVSDYLSSGFLFRASMGFAPCRICGKRNNGAVEYTDGVYAWPEGLAHYVDNHEVRLPEEFVRHVCAQSDAWDEAVIDEDWWRGQRGH